MQRILIIYITLLILLLLFTGCVTGGKEVWTSMKFDHAGQDICNIEDGLAVDHVFKFKNTESDTLKINRVYSS